MPTRNFGTVTGRVVRVIRHGNTIYGNPMVSVVLDTDEYGVTHRVSNNAGIVYGIENPEFRNTPHTFALTRAGRISHVVRA